MKATILTMVMGAVLLGLLAGPSVAQRHVHVFPEKGGKPLPLTTHECTALGGDIVADTKCPETISNAGGDSKLKGKFACSVKTKDGQTHTSCIDEGEY